MLKAPEEEITKERKKIDKKKEIELETEERETAKDRIVGTKEKK